MSGQPRIANARWPRVAVRRYYKEITPRRGPCVVVYLRLPVLLATFIPRRVLEMRVLKIYLRIAIQYR